MSYKKGDRVQWSAEGLNRGFPQRQGVIATRPREIGASVFGRCYAVLWEGNKFPEYVHNELIEAAP